MKLRTFNDIVVDIEMIKYMHIHDEKKNNSFYANIILKDNDELFISKETYESMIEYFKGFKGHVMFPDPKIEGE